MAQFLPPVDPEPRDVGYPMPREEQAQIVGRWIDAESYAGQWEEAFRDLYKVFADAQEHRLAVRLNIDLDDAFTRDRLVYAKIIWRPELLGPGRTRRRSVLAPVVALLAPKGTAPDRVLRIREACAPPPLEGSLPELAG